MTKRTDSANKGEGGDGVALPPPPSAKENLHFHANNKVYKSGHLLLSSKGIGWTSWKKRWFILTRTSLVFFRSDPNAIPLKGNEVNVTLGGIDLNSSGSVVVKEDKKLLTVLFADGRDGRTFTVKAETLENLHEWKTALEEALADAPSVALDVGQNGSFKNDQTDAADVSSGQTKDGPPVKSVVIGRPILLALEEIDGSPSFLEKALRFVEEHGVKVEGILRQAADVEDVERRIHEYEQGKNEFSPVEDAHIIADCVKYVIRELPSSPVPASCCNALLEAYRTKCSMRVSAMCTAICETFPEPNRRLLQRILLMMQSVASHNTETRMSTSGVAACMAPLLLRPLLAGDCDLGCNFDMAGDGSVQLLQAAAAANLAQAIIITLLDEYDKIFGEGSMSADLYSESEGSGSDSKEFTDDDEDYTTEGSDIDIDDEVEDAYDATSCESDETRDSARLQGSQRLKSGYKHPQGDDADCPNQTLSESSPPKVGLHQDSRKGCGDVCNRGVAQPSATGAIFVPKDAETSTFAKSDTSKGSVPGDRQTTVSGHTTGEKNLPVESIGLRLEEEKEIQMLEATKTDLQNKIAQQSKENLRLQDEVEKRKNTLQERRKALENEVTRLQEQLEKERELRTTLEAGLKTSHGHLVVSSAMDKKVKADFEEIAQAEVDIASLKQKADGLGRQLNQQREQNSRFEDDVVGQQHLRPNDKLEQNDDHKQGDTPSTLHGHQKLVRSKVSREKRMAETVLGYFEGTTALEKNDKSPDKSNMDNDNRKQDSVMLTNENALQNQQTDSSQNKISDWLSPSTSVQEGLERPASVNTKRTASSEGTANTISSALSKLSMRLKLLREGQTQIKNENPQEGMDITRTSVENPGATLEAGGQNVVKSQVCDWKPPEANQGSTSKKESVLSSENHSDKATRPDSQPYLDREMPKSGPPTEKDGATTKRTDSR